MSKAAEDIQNRIDNYFQTIIAIVGFMNFYKFDSDQDPILLFQGRRLKPSGNGSDEPDFVTPDIGIMLPNSTGVLGEVKHTFPKDKKFWIDAFNQVLKYDDDLTGWPNEKKIVSNHDLVLLTHTSRSRAVVNFYREKKEAGDISFNRPFSIVEYNLVSERKNYFFFRIEEGVISDEQVNAKLQEGVPVPMTVLLFNYAAVKLYDDKPEVPYLMYLIWNHVVLEKASELEQFRNLRKNQKIDVTLSIDEIVDTLRMGFSFRLLNSEYSDMQPHIPKKPWVKEACQKFIEWNEAKWNDTEKSTLTFKAHKQYKDTLKHFINAYVGEGNIGQATLFDLDEPDQ